MNETIILNIEELNDEIIDLRAKYYFDKEMSPGDVIDEFDKYSFFSTIRFENTLIGTERITDTSNISVFKSWLKENDCMPKGKDIYEISRTVIKKEWRKKAIYNILSIFTVEYLRKNKNAKNINWILMSIYTNGCKK